MHSLGQVSPKYTLTEQLSTTQPCHDKPAKKEKVRQDPTWPSQLPLMRRHTHYCANASQYVHWHRTGFWVRTKHLPPKERPHTKITFICLISPCFTLPNSPDSFHSFITAMWLTVNWVAHQKGRNGCTVSNHTLPIQESRTRTASPTKVNDYAQIFHCPSFGQHCVMQGPKANTIFIYTWVQSPPVPSAPPHQALQHLVNNPEDKTARKRKLL